MRSHKRLFRFHGWLLFLLVAVHVRAAPITSDTALPAHEGELIFRTQMKYLRSTDDPGYMNRELTVWSVPNVIAYGVTEKLTIFGISPFLDKSLDLTTGGLRQTRGDSGMADFRLLTRFTLGQWDRPGETLRLGSFLGLEIPTGSDNERDSLGRLPSPLQLGSGSWDPIVGTLFTWQSLRRQFDSSLSYKFNTEANGFRFGDEFNLNISYQHRLWPRKLKRGVPGFLYGVFEANFRHQRANTTFLGRDSNSGGSTLYLTPGIQLATKRLILESAVQVPVVQELNGRALRNDFIVTAGFRVNF